MDLFYTKQRTVHPVARWLNIALALLLLSALLAAAFQGAVYSWNWPAVAPYHRVFLQGWATTVLIASASLVLSAFIGLALAFAQLSPLLPLRYLAKVYVELFRGTPLLVQVLILFYVVGTTLGVTNRYLVGSLTLSLFAGAYISEMIRAGILSVGQSQLESARAIGLTPAQTFRFVIFPQALKHTLPPLTGQFVSLIKDSSLLSVVSVSELAFVAQNVNTNTYSTLECFLVMAAGYLVLTLPIAYLARTLERRVAYDT